MNYFVFTLSFLVFGFSSFLEATHAQSNASDTGCVCEGYSCGCCLYMHVPEIGLDDTACVNVTYLPKEYGIHFTMNIDNFFLYNETISVRSPPALCAGAPFLEELAELCVKFYDLDATMSKLHGCVELEAVMKTIVVAKYDLGCFDIGKVDKSNKNQFKWKKEHLSLINRIRNIIGL